MVPGEYIGLPSEIVAEGMFALREDVVEDASHTEHVH